MKETEIAAIGKVWLESLGFEVFSEVVFSGRRIDLVGRLAGVIVCVEAKRTFGLGVIAQAWRWYEEASESWVCIPRRGRHRHTMLGERLCADLGLGVIYVDPDQRTAREPWTVACWPLRKEPKNLARWEKRLHPEQKTAALAGTNGGGYVTDFSLTATRLNAHVAAHPGCTLREAVLAIEHHYQRRASAISHLGNLLTRVGSGRPGTLAGIRIEGKGAKALLWPMGEEF